MAKLRQDKNLFSVKINYIPIRKKNNKYAPIKQQKVDFCVYFNLK